MEGLVLGMSNTVVRPPRMAPRVPVGMVSTALSPGSRRCTWGSISPGSTCRPVASRVFPAVASVPTPSPAIRPLVTPTWVASKPHGKTQVPLRISRSYWAGIGGPFRFREERSRHEGHGYRGRWAGGDDGPEGTMGRRGRWAGGDDGPEGTMGRRGRWAGGDEWAKSTSVVTK